MAELQKRLKFIYSKNNQIYSMGHFVLLSVHL